MIFEKVKRTLRLMNTTAFDEDIQDLIYAACIDLGIAGVENVEETDPIILRAICTYCKLNFGEPEEADRLKASYDEQKAQLSTHTGYTRWSE